MQILKKYSTEELKTIIANHQHWLKEDCEGWENMKADLRDADLSAADLSAANLRAANLSAADLSDANLRDADLSAANLSDADLRDADLSAANLSAANLRAADLRAADLSAADLSDADLRAADLRAADLSAANLSAANLSAADLRAADLSAADLSDADLRDADLSAADLRAADLSAAKGITMACPSDGAFIGWKMALCENGIAIVKLQIPEDAKRSSATGRKCRCDKALVLAIYDEGGNEVYQARSWWNNDFIYRVGETVTPNSFDDNRWNECSGGIHFFITSQEAEDYEL